MEPITERLYKTVLEAITDGYISAWIPGEYDEMLVKGWEESHMDILKGEKIPSLKYALKLGWVPIGILPEDEANPEHGGRITVIYGQDQQIMTVRKWVEENPDWEIGSKAAEF